MQDEIEITINYTSFYISNTINTIIKLSNRSHFLWVYRRDNPRGMLGKHEQSL